MALIPFTAGSNKNPHTLGFHVGSTVDLTIKNVVIRHLSNAATFNNVHSTHSVTGVSHGERHEYQRI